MGTTETFGLRIRYRLSPPNNNTYFTDGGVSEGLEDDPDGYSSTESVDSAEKHPYSRKSKYA